MATIEGSGSGTEPRPDRTGSTDEEISALRRLLGIADLRERLAQLTKALSVSVLGVEFIENPEGFVVAAMLNWLITTSFAVTGQIALLLREMWILFANVVADALDAALGPLGAVAGGLVLDLLGLVDALISSFVAASGPFAPFVALAAWGAVTVLILALLGLVVRLIKSALSGRFIPL